MLLSKKMNTRRKNKSLWHFIASVFLFLILSIFVLSADSARAGLANHLVINEIQSDSVSGTGGSYNDFVELYNPTSQDIVLDSWSLQKHSSASTSVIYKQTLSGIIRAFGYYLVVRGHANTDQALKDMADNLTAGSFSIASNNTIYLVDDNIEIVDKNDLNIVDFVGMGNAEVFEGLASASNPSETKSIARVPSGEDTDQNSVDFVAQTVPSPENSSVSANNLDGVVLVTIIPANEAVQNISPTSAEIVFTVNSNGIARVDYGLDTGYANVSPDTALIANTEASISLNGLACDTTYHYSIYAENNDNSDNYASMDASFRTLPCGIRLDSLSMTKSSARANNDFLDGWAWSFDITIWDTRETSLKMKFDTWAGDASLSSASNMQFSVNGVDWIDILADDIYSALGADIAAIDNDLSQAGRQVNIQVRMKVPVGTLAGFYNSNYGILTE